MTTESLRSYAEIINPVDFVFIDSFSTSLATDLSVGKGSWMVKFTGGVQPTFPLDSVVLKDLTVFHGTIINNTYYASTFARLGDFTLTKIKGVYYARFNPGDVGFIERVSWMEDGKNIDVLPRATGLSLLMVRTPKGMKILSRFRMQVIPPIYYRSSSPAWKGEIEFYFYLTPTNYELGPAVSCTGYPPPPPPPPPPPTGLPAINPGITPQTIEEAIARGLMTNPPPRYGLCINKFTDSCDRYFVVDFEYVPNPFVCTTSARTNGYVIKSLAGSQEFKLDYTTTHGNPVVELTMALGPEPLVPEPYAYHVSLLYANGVPLQVSPWPLSVTFPSIATFYL